VEFDPASQKIALPAQSDGSIRLLGVDERRRLAREEHRQTTRPHRLRLLIALVTLTIGGFTIWYSHRAPERAPVRTAGD
jgi:hypothetical protein